jgi:hypothetical protein
MSSIDAGENGHNEKSHRNPSAMLRFLRSYLGRAAVGLILTFVISSSNWWQAFSEYQKVERIARRIMDAGGIAGRRSMLPTGWNSFCLFFHLPALSC